MWQGAGEGGGEEGGGKEEERGQDGNGDGDGGEQGLYSGVYRVVVAAMEARGVRRIFVLGTLSMEDGGDWGTGDGDGDGKAEGGKNGWRDWLWRKWTRFGVRVMVGVVWAFFWRGWWNMVEVGRYFDSLATAAGAGEAGTGVDWTVFRIGLLFNGISPPPPRGSSISVLTKYPYRRPTSNRSSGRLPRGPAALAEYPPERAGAVAAGAVYLWGSHVGGAEACCCVGEGGGGGVEV